MSELKTCPCCGSCDASIKVMTVGTFRVFCESCRLCIPGCQTREEAIEAWNTRAPQSDFVNINDRRPNLCERVLAYDANGFGWVTARLQTLGWYLEGSLDLNCRVTHWMPLPEPPQ